jgi:anti-anti-sigma factor
MSQGVHRVVAPAEVDPSTVDELVEQLAAASAGSVVTVDCSGVTFMDSAGVRALSMAAERQEAGGGGLRVVRPTVVVRRILDITDLTSLISDDGDDPSR